MANNNMSDVDIISRFSGLGGLSQSVTNMLYGINHRNTGSPVPVNRDVDALTVFVRPRLNLSYDNLSQARILTPLLTDNENTLQRYVRAMLDPVGQKERNITSPLVDPLQPFIPILTNSLLSCNGWPDIQLDTYTSESGIAKEEFSMVDSIARIYHAYDLTCGFRNQAGDPITLLFTVWCMYASMIYEGILTPYPDAIIENEIDYMTRVYRIILDPSKQIVQKIGCCAAGFPTATPLGAAFNFSSDNVFNTENDQISIPFRCMGAFYLDPIIIDEFNKVTVLFNPGMDDSTRESLYTKLAYNEKDYFVYRGYMRIDPLSHELEIWVPNAVYAEYKTGVDYVNSINK